MIQRIEMPEKNGRRIPNPYRYLCDQGHLHPSRVRAVKCNEKARRKALKAGGAP
jgi:hypothetical protein